MTEPVVIDVDVAIGRLAGDGLVPDQSLDVAALLRRMDESGVDRAVVYHAVAKEHDPWSGNQLLLEELNRHPRLDPAFVLLPPFTHEQPPVPQLMEVMVEAGVGFVRLFPSSDLDGHRFALREWCIGPVLAALEEAQVAVGVDFSLFRRGEPPWDDVVDVCSSHPDLALVLMDVQGRNNRNLYALLDRFPNLVVCTAGLNVHCGIEDITRRFGAERLMFGSHAPWRSMRAGRFAVERADIGPDQETQILGGTALTLLGLSAGEAEPAR